MATREKVGIAVRSLQRLTKLQVWLGHVGTKLEKFSSKSTHAREAAANIKNAITLVGQAADNLKQAPADFGGSAKKSQLEVGTVVCIREDKRADYGDVLDTEDMTGLTVKATGKKKVKCITRHGDIIFPPRGDLSIEAAA